ncbi:MAG: DUF1501 domain-containing protein [Acidobacteriota bacterium]
MNKMIGKLYPKTRVSAEELARKFPHYSNNILTRPDVSRRGFFKAAAAGLGGSFLLGQQARAQSQIVVNSGMKTKGTAKNCIVIHLVGAMSHTDTFDLKFQTGVQPASFNPTMVNGTNWPMGLMPKIGNHLGDVGIIRSMSAHALVHSLAQTWVQIGRNPAAALGDIAPNVGSVIAIEKEKERKAGQVLPTFIGLNAGAAVGPGYLSAAYAPFQVSNPRVGNTGVSDTTNSRASTQTAFDILFNKLQGYDGSLRVQAPYGSALQDMDALYAQAHGMMYSPAINAAFGVAQTDSNRYGTGSASTTFGNACLVAKQILAADQGTRFIQIDFGSWDHHTDIYGTANPNGSNVITMGTQLDNGVGAMLDDLKSAGLFDQTLVVILGEFGRTTGTITAAGGRDHFLIQSAMMAGGGIKGGTVIGTTNALGSAITDFGWAGSSTAPNRNAWAEDIESTIYSAMGVDWTTIRYDDPFKRGYEYVPFASIGTYGPINELFK